MTKTRTRNHLLFYVNGERITVSGRDALMPLGDFLRQKLNLTGTKIVCAEGDCGACSVLKFTPTKPTRTKTRPLFLPVNSCILNLSQIDGSSLVTVDRLREHSVTAAQTAMRECHGSQCGFCTPGFVMALTGLIEKKKLKKEPRIEEKEAKNALTGNLCRCTGYAPILKAACEINTQTTPSVSDAFYSSSQEKDLLAHRKISVVIESESRSGEEFSLVLPASLKVATSTLREFQKKKTFLHILSGGTDLGVLVNKQKIQLKHALSLVHLSELEKIKKTKSTLTIGARVTLSTLRKEVRKSHPEFSTFLDLFASPQIKNSGTLAGNLATGSPIGDTLPFLLSMDATIHLQSTSGKRKVKATQFWKGYRQTDRRTDEIITAVAIPTLKKSETLRLFKASQRKDMDISAVSAAFRVQFEERKIKTSQLSLGGVAATPVRLPQLEAYLKGKSPRDLTNSEQLEESLRILDDCIHPLSDLRGSMEFRRLLARNFWKKFIYEMSSPRKKESRDG
jgi:xanthine dehydrogenase small subunit